MSSNVSVRGLTACINEADGTLVLSCTITSNDDASGKITGAGLILNTADGETIATCYAECSDGCASVAPSINLPPGDLKVGDTVRGAASGEAGGEHFFVEEKLSVGKC